MKKSAKEIKVFNVKPDPKREARLKMSNYIALMRELNVTFQRLTALKNAGMIQDVSAKQRISAGLDLWDKAINKIWGIMQTENKGDNND